MASGGDLLFVVKRSHAFYWRPHLMRSTPTYRWSMHWLRLFWGVPQSLSPLSDDLK